MQIFLLNYIITIFLLFFFRNKLNKNPVSQTSSIRKKPFDSIPDHHYRDAISRLKVMLSDSSYSPLKYASSSSLFKSVTDDETDTTENTIIERPAFKEISKYYPYKPYSIYSNISSSYSPNKFRLTSQVPVPCECFEAWTKIEIQIFLLDFIWISLVNVLIFLN